MPDLSRVLSQLQRERNRMASGLERLDQAIHAIESLSGKNNRGRKRGRRISAAGRARIAAAQRARWAKTRNQAAKPAARVISISARRKMAAAQRVRRAKWKRQHAR